MLRAEVTQALTELHDEDGTVAVASVTRWEDAADILDLPADRVGDLLVASQVGFGWNEELTDDLTIFATPLATGYKQGIPPADNTAVWTPFVIAGPGVQAGHRIEQPIHHVDQLPTILTAMGLSVPAQTQGHVIGEVLVGTHPTP